MYLDKNLMMSAAQAVTATAASSDYIDQGTAGDAVGKELYFVIQVRTAAASSGSSTVDFELQCDDNTSFSSPTTLWKQSAIAKATLVANYEVCKVKVPVGAERYLRAKYTVNTADLSAGAFDAFLTDNVKVGSQ